MLKLKNILERGYFPKELPPLFSTRSIASHCASLPSTAKDTSYCLRYSYSKYATVRRTLSIPNPAHFLPLAAEVAKSWTVLETHCASSKISKTQPTTKGDRAINWATSLNDIPSIRAQHRVGGRYILQADVAACYATMYTHAIPWALHRKAVAKEDRGHKKSLSGGLPLVGNVLDFMSRNIQSGQTIGIPVGPDTSVVIAEAILTSVDNVLASKVKSLDQAFRFVDDYEFVCETLPEAEQIQSDLQDALGEFQLQLNPRKTRILELPQVLDTPWVNDLASFRFDSLQGPGFKSGLIRYFSRAFELARGNPGDPVLKYAVRRMPEIKSKSFAELIQQLLFQSAVIDPGTLQTALYVAFEHKRQGYPLDLEAMERAISAITMRHTALQHGGDIAGRFGGL